MEYNRKCFKQGFRIAKVCYELSLEINVETIYSEGVLIQVGNYIQIVYAYNVDKEK